jgi:hypothetical protein
VVLVVVVLIKLVVKPQEAEILLQHHHHKETLVVVGIQRVVQVHFLAVAVVLVLLVVMVLQAPCQARAVQEVLHITPSTYLLGSLLLIQVKAI